MKKNYYIFTVSLLLFLTNCAGSDDVGNGDVGNGDVGNGDKIAFREIGSEKTLQINLTVDRLIESYKNPGFLNDYTTPVTIEVNNERKWEKKRQVLNTVCSLNSPPVPTSIENGIAIFDTPISVVSPDGAYLGFAEDSWEPVWSPDGDKVAFACGQDEQDNIFVVSSYDHSTPSSMQTTDGKVDCGQNCVYETKNWSREGSAKLSDQMEVFVSDISGSAVTQLTNNQNGDWLPQWFPTTSFSTEGKLFEKIAVERPILIETNRNHHTAGYGDKSDALLLSTFSTKSWRLSDDYYKAQSPVWSKKGSFIVFKGGGEEDESKLVVTYDLEPRQTIQIDQDGVPIPWNE